ncbi:hypothetical protein [Bacillus salipaludis]|uniref:Uncharacterized protein n=1 Tax=Bacillus salipaludis TaxID=2547811 RepID=A0AA90TQQ6_9BACI|nr:hypothetical protein [Bacillus salipaludis]MDQ6598456.1 hypothetical protein [Bacillus salipaludis]
MRQYIFLLNEPVGPREIKIEASGMMEAFKNSKRIPQKDHGKYKEKC